jgi:hypothetical protein
MANIINPSDLAFNGEEVRAISEAIMEEVFAKPALTEVLTAYTGIKAKKQIVFLGRLNGLVGQASDTSTCAPVENTAGITNTEKFWNPVYIDDRFSECWTDLLETFFIYATKNGLEKADLTTTDFATFFIERYQDEIFEAMHRFIWFGDEDAASIAASPAGNFAVATFVAKRWNAIDGLWKQLFAIAAADADRRTSGTGTISVKNDEATFALQAFNDTDTTNRVVTKTLQKVIFGADYRLQDKQDKVIIVTKSVADQYIRELEAETSNGIDVAFTYLQDGIMVLKRMGVTIIALSFWDRMITGYTQNAAGTGYFRRHRILMTVKENLAFGTEEESNLSEVDVFYDKKLKTNYFDFGANLDAKVLQDYMVQVSY